MSKIRIEASPNGNPDHIDIRATLFHGMLEIQLTAIELSQSKIIPETIRAFQKAADRITIKEDDLGVQIMAGLTSTRLHVADTYGIKTCVSDRLHRLKNKLANSPA